MSASKPSSISVEETVHRSKLEEFVCEIKGDSEAGDKAFHSVDLRFESHLALFEPSFSARPHYVNRPWTAKKAELLWPHGVAFGGFEVLVPEGTQPRFDLRIHSTSGARCLASFQLRMRMSRVLDLPVTEEGETKPYAHYKTVDDMYIYLLPLTIDSRLPDHVARTKLVLVNACDEDVVLISGSVGIPPLETFPPRMLPLLEHEMLEELERTLAPSTILPPRITRLTLRHDHWWISKPRATTFVRDKRDVALLAIDLGLPVADLHRVKEFELFIHDHSYMHAAHHHIFVAMWNRFRLGNEPAESSAMLYIPMNGLCTSTAGYRFDVVCEVQPLPAQPPPAATEEPAAAAGAAAGAGTSADDDGGGRDAK